MKIAKKVLAVVMALAMISALSVMAFASGSYVLTATKGEGTLDVSVRLVGGAGATDDKITVTYDPAVLKLDKVAKGKDQKAMANVEAQTYMGDNNTEEEGKVVHGYGFSQSLSAEYLEVEDGDPIDANDFEFIVIKFIVLNEDANTELNLTSDNFGTAELKVEGKAPADDPTPVDPGKPDPGKDEPAKEDPAKEEPAKEEPSKPANPDNGDKKTGDNMALAAAGAVVALAGAAFVISKKRK